LGNTKSVGDSINCRQKFRRLLLARLFLNCWRSLSREAICRERYPLPTIKSVGKSRSWYSECRIVSLVILVLDSQEQQQDQQPAADSHKCPVHNQLDYKRSLVHVNLPCDSCSSTLHPIVEPNIPARTGGRSE
jgi:hypothetical protein